VHLKERNIVFKMKIYQELKD